MTPGELRSWVGDMDIYLFDQLLNDRFPPGTRLLDAGCGDGRNLHYFLRAGYEIHAVDRAPGAIAAVRRMASRVASDVPPDHFQVGLVEDLPFPDACFDAVISSAVFHFADDGAHFGRMVAEVWRVLRPGGVLFARTASRNGLGDRATSLGNGRYALPDGSERFLVDDELLVGMTNLLGGELLDSIKTVNVQGLRCMSTWVVRKSTQQQAST